MLCSSFVAQCGCALPCGMRGRSSGRAVNAGLCHFGRRWQVLGLLVSSCGHTNNAREGLAENDCIMSRSQAGKWHLKEACSTLFSPRVMAVLIKKQASLA